MVSTRAQVSNEEGSASHPISVVLTTKMDTQEARERIPSETPSVDIAVLEALKNQEAELKQKIAEAEQRKKNRALEAQLKALQTEEYTARIPTIPYERPTSDSKPLSPTSHNSSDKYN